MVAGLPVGKRQPNFSQIELCKAWDEVTNKIFDANPLGYVLALEKGGLTMVITVLRDIIRELSN